MQPPRRRGISSGVNRLLALVVAALFLLPLIWAASASLRTTGAPWPRTMDWIPSPLAWSNYRTVFEIIELRRFALNSLFVVALATPQAIASEEASAA